MTLLNEYPARLPRWHIDYITPSGLDLIRKSASADPETPAKTMVAMMLTRLQAPRA